MSDKIAHLRQFILIDHSLKDLGGHHFPYALSVLQAAADAGFQPVLATHVQFRERTAFDPRWPLHAVFHHASYSRYTLDTQAPPSRLDSGVIGAAIRWLRSGWVLRERARLAASFAADCAQLLRAVTPAAGDVLFLATASELDLAGLSQLLRTTAAPHDVDWHLQFHFGLFRARPPQYARLAATEQAVRAAFASALAPINAARLHFYCTTDPLTLQYQRLGVAPFTTLPYPVHALFSAPQAPRPVHQPLRIACLGHSRREKGYRQAPTLLRALWDDYFRDGRAQLVMQSPRPPLRRVLQSTIRKLGSLGTEAVDYAAAGLDLPHYAELLRGCDVGLLLYDSARYYDRCSGVLLELLSAGVPVVVPAGCWLGEQIAPVQQRYLKVTEERLRHAQRLLQLPLPLATFNLDAASIIEFGVAPGSAGSTLLIVLQWLAPVSPGTFLRIELLSRDRFGNPNPPGVQVVGRDINDPTLRVLFRLQPGVTGATLRFSNAFRGEPVSITGCTAYKVTGAAVPLGAIGLAVGEPAMAVAALSDILEHIADYKQRAAEYAVEIARHYNAANVVAQLTAPQAHR